MSEVNELLNNEVTEVAEAVTEVAETTVKTLTEADIPDILANATELAKNVAKAECFKTAVTTGGIIGIGIGAGALIKKAWSKHKAKKAEKEAKKAEKAAKAEEKATEETSTKKDEEKESKKK